MQTSCIDPDNARVFRGANHQNPAGDNQSIAFNSIIVSANEHADREAGLPGRVDRSCCSCGNGHNRHTVTRRGPEIMTACTCGTLGPDMDAETCEHYCGRRGE